MNFNCRPTKMSLHDSAELCGTKTGHYPLTPNSGFIVFLNSGRRQTRSLIKTFWVFKSLFDGWKLVFPTCCPRPVKNERLVCSGGASTMTGTRCNSRVFYNPTTHIGTFWPTHLKTTTCTVEEQVGVAIIINPLLTIWLFTCTFIYFSTLGWWHCISFDPGPIQSN